MAEKEVHLNVNRPSPNANRISSSMQITLTMEEAANLIGWREIKLYKAGIDIKKLVDDNNKLIKKIEELKKEKEELTSSNLDKK